jgi:hypothetical protein
MNARAFFVLGLLSCGLWGLAMTAGAATRIDLNRDWSFRVESGLYGVNAGWPTSIPAGTSPVDLPQSWNRAGKDDEYLGTLVVKLLRPDGSISMERSLASQ